MKIGALAVILVLLVISWTIFKSLAKHRKKHRPAGNTVPLGHFTCPDCGYVTIATEAVIKCAGCQGMFLMMRKS